MQQYHISLNDDGTWSIHEYSSEEKDGVLICKGIWEIEETYYVKSGFPGTDKQIGPMIDGILYGDDQSSELGTFHYRDYSNDPSRITQQTQVSKRPVGYAVIDKENNFSIAVDGKELSLRCTNKYYNPIVLKLEPANE